MRYLCQKGYPLTLVAPGNDVGEILRVAKMLCPAFEQTIILGYPPFCKTFIDAGIAQQIPWADFNLKMVFAGEVFSEEWRLLVAKRAGIKSPKSDIHGIYGTADAGMLALYPLWIFLFNKRFGRCHQLISMNNRRFSV